MNRHRIFVAGLLTLTLGFGLWVSAVDLQPTASSFSEGDIVTASDFNALFATIDQNFTDTETAIDALETDKVDVDGDTMSGPLQIAFDGGADTIGLLVKKTGAGPLMVALNEDTGQGLEVSADGSLAIGTAGSPQITLDVATGDAILAGTVRNAAGDSLLPVAFGQIGTITGNAYVESGTANVASATYDESIYAYRIALSGIEFSYRDYVAVATVHSSSAYAFVASGSGDVLVYTRDYTGAPVFANFSFLVYDADD